jgi:PST family polysaccharide transporter
MNEEFKQSVAKGALWAFASSWARIGISLIAFAVIARIVGPEIYGQNAMASALVTLAQVLVGPALGEVVVQRQSIDARRLSAFFWLLQAAGLLICALLILGRGLIAHSASSPEVSWLVIVYALTVPITALQTIPEALLGKRMEFKVQALGSGLGTLAGSAAGIALALTGHGLWSLAVLQFLQTALQALVIWFGARWAPQGPGEWSGLGPLLRYSAGSLGVRLLNELDTQLPKLMIGSLLGVTALGYYSVARRIFDLLKDMLIVPLNVVFLPTLARARRQGDDVESLFRSALRLSSAVANPAFLGLIAVSPLAIHALFGPDWAPAVPALQIMALLGLRTAVASFNGVGLRVYDRPMQQVGVAALGVILAALSVAVAAPWGLIAVIGALVFRQFATWPLSAWLVARLSIFPAWEQFTTGLPTLGAAVLMSAAVYTLQLSLEPHLGVVGSLAACLVFGALSYVVLVRVLAPEDFRTTLSLLRRGLPKRSLV